MGPAISRQPGQKTTVPNPTERVLLRQMRFLEVSLHLRQRVFSAQDFCMTENIEQHKKEISNEEIIHFRISN